jgi:signal transduction histidine kinase
MQLLFYELYSTHTSQRREYYTSIFLFIFLTIVVHFRFEHFHRAKFWLRLEAFKGIQAVSMAKEYETADKAKTAFLANISHEIRTPLNGVMGLTQVLMDTKLTTEQQEYAKLILSTSERLSSLINDILDLSKMEAQRLELRMLPCNLSDVVREVTELMSFSMFQKGIEFSTYITPSCNVVCDGNRIKQILLNLLTNALKFTTSGFIDLWVDRIQDTKKFTEVIIKVTDSGIGIKDEDIHRLFNRFSQIDNSLQRQYNGAGLGLAVCHQLIQLMGGTIKIESEFGVGTVFTVKLKLSKPKSEGLNFRTEEIDRKNVLAPPEQRRQSESALRNRPAISVNNEQSTIISILSNSSFAIEEKERERCPSTDCSQGIPRLYKTPKIIENEVVDPALSILSGSDSLSSLTSTLRYKFCIFVDPSFPIRRSMYHTLADLRIQPFTCPGWSTLLRAFDRSRRVSNISNTSRNSAPNNLLFPSTLSEDPKSFLDVDSEIWSNFENHIMKSKLQSHIQEFNNETDELLVILDESIVSTTFPNGNFPVDDSFHHVLRHQLERYSAELFESTRFLRDKPLHIEKLRYLIMVKKSDVVPNTIPKSPLNGLKANNGTISSSANTVNSDMHASMSTEIHKHLVKAINSKKGLARDRFEVIYKPLYYGTVTRYFKDSYEAGLGRSDIIQPLHQGQKHAVQQPSPGVKLQKKSNSLGVQPTPFRGIVSKGEKNETGAAYNEISIEVIDSNDSNLNENFSLLQEAGKVSNHLFSSFNNQQLETIPSVKTLPDYSQSTTLALQNADPVKEESDKVKEQTAIKNKSEDVDNAVKPNESSDQNSETTMEKDGPLHSTGTLDSGNNDLEPTSKDLPNDLPITTTKNESEMNQEISINIQNPDSSSSDAVLKPVIPSDEQALGGIIRPEVKAKLSRRESMVSMRKGKNVLVAEDNPVMK